MTSNLPAAPAPASDLAQASAGEEIRRLAATALAYADASRAPATRRAYSSAWRAFSTWCEARGFSPLPASAELVALYLSDRAGALKVSTLALHRAAIEAAHCAHDLSPPDSAALREVWDGLRRTHGAPPAKKTAIRAADIRRAFARRPRSLAELRDRALILIGFASALRRSELAELSLDADARVQARFADEGLEIIVLRSKGDPFGAGATIAVPFGARSSTCPVKALSAWLAAASIDAGPVFRLVDRAGHIGGVAVSDRFVARTIKRVAEQNGLDAGIYAGHSLRRGMITEAVLGGASPEAVQAHARHARWDTTRGYIEQASRFYRSAAGKLGL